jgi:phosphate transport system substrate-binding protein
VRIHRRFARLGRAWVAAVLPALAPGTALAADLEGAGATFPAPLYARWAQAYQRATGLDIRYDAIGSGAGIERIEGRRVDFAATDAPLTEERLRASGLMQFPATIGGVVPVVNIAGVAPGQLKLSGPVLGDIYLGRIVKWNDPAITALNPGLGLPAQNITVVHRSDASGTTFLLSDWLSKLSEPWRTRMGSASVLSWPAGIGVGAVGNEGVASFVQRTRVSIGYVEYAYAKSHRLSPVSLINREGRFVQPDSASFAAAAASVDWRSAPGFRQVLTDRPGAASWPIAGASFILLRTDPDDAQRSRRAMQFFEWALTRGQAEAEALGYVPLPAELVGDIVEAWRRQLPTRPP